MKDEKLEKMIEEYNEIEIPKELKGIVEVSVRRAKRDQYLEEKRNRSRMYMMKRMGIATIAAMIALIIVMNTNKNIAYAMSDIPILASIIKVITFSTYENERENMRADIEVPKIELEDSNNPKLLDSAEQLNKSVKDYTDQIIKQYKNDLELSDGKGYEEVTLNYEVITNNENIFSIKMNTTVSLNTSNVDVMIYHINKRTGKLFTLKDIFIEDVSYEDVLIEELKRQMYEEMQLDHSRIYFLDDQEIEVNWEEELENSNFYFDKNRDLILVFDKYTIAPGYMGVCKFKIPRKITAHILKEDYLN